jgi:ADP-ribose pyrophosphatase YjhB (NUDIX family)
MAERDIQKEILTRLLSQKDARYRDLHPESVANDLFNYHLQFLVKKGLIKKSKNTYSLSDKGIRFVAEENPLGPTGKIADKFKLNVLTVLVKHEGKKIFVLNQLRKRQPSYGNIGVMGGTLKKGEKITDAAKRKLEEETGLKAEFDFLGVERRKILDKQGDAISDMFFYICLSEHSTGKLISKTLYGENMWVLIDEAILNELEQPAPILKIVNILQAIRAGTHKEIPIFFFEEEYQASEKEQSVK